MNQRMRRINEAVREIVAEQVGSLKDPRIGFVTVTDVRTSPDLRHAEVFYTVLPDDEASLEATGEGLSSAATLLRRELGARLRTRNIPGLHFTHDAVPEHGRHIERLLREAKPGQDAGYDPDTYRTPVDRPDGDRREEPAGEDGSDLWDEE